MIRLKGNIVCEKNCQLVIDLKDKDAEEFIIKEGEDVVVEWEELKKWSD